MTYRTVKVTGDWNLFSDDPLTYEATLAPGERERIAREWYADRMDAIEGVADGINNPSEADIFDALFPEAMPS